MSVSVMNRIIIVRGGGQAGGVKKVILPRGSYQVQSESESEMKSERDNCWKTIWLQLMCCAP